MHLNRAQDIFSHPQDVEEIRKLKACIEDYRDFIGWLFDNHDDEGIHWMSEGEAWDKFRLWEEKQNFEPPKPPQP